MRSLGALPAPGLSLDVLANPTPEELARYTEDRAYPRVLRHQATVPWRYKNVLAKVKTTLEPYSENYHINYLMWHGLVVVEHTKGAKTCTVSVYGARFVG